MLSRSYVGAHKYMLGAAWRNYVSLTVFAQLALQTSVRLLVMVCVSNLER